MGSLLGYLLRIRTTPAPGSTIPREVEVTGTDNGALNVNVVSGGGSGASAEEIGEAVDAELRASPLPVSGPLTDTQLRATAVPVSGTVALSNPPSNPPSASDINTALKATAQSVTGPLTDTQLRATAVPVSISGGATAANQTTGNNSLSSIDGKLPALVSSRVPVVVGAALPAGTNNIGDVDVLSVPAPLNVTGGGTESSALRVTIANNSTGVLSVDDNGGSLTVDGTVALSNPPSNPPSASAIGDDLRGGAKLPANILMGIVGAKRVSAGAASARVQLATSGIVGVSITAVGAAIRYALGDGTVTASATDHYLPEGQSRDFRVATSQYIAAIRAGDTDAVLEITELSA